jgi:hypothetical protein
MANVLKRARKLLKKVAVKAADSPLGRQVKKIPAPIRKGYLAGMMVPVPGAGEVGAMAGAGVWAKGAIEHQVRKHTGRPYRLFERGDARRETRATRVSASHAPCSMLASPCFTPARRMIAKPSPPSRKGRKETQSKAGFSRSPVSLCATLRTLRLGGKSAS